MKSELIFTSYMVIQKARFMNLKSNVSGRGDLTAGFFQFLLQPVVENAIVHGFSEE